MNNLTNVDGNVVSVKNSKKIGPIKQNKHGKFIFNIFYDNFIKGNDLDSYDKIESTVLFTFEDEITANKARDGLIADWDIFLERT